MQINNTQKKALRHLVNATDEEFNDLVNYINTYLMPKQASNVKDHVSISGKVVRAGAEVITIFKANGKLYPADDHNCNVMDSYLHTGNEKYLAQFEQELPF